MNHKKRTAGDAAHTGSEMGRRVGQVVVEKRWISRVHLQHQHAWKPPTDVFESPEEIVVHVEIPGMREEDFNVVFADGILTISGVRLDPGSSSRRVFQQMEICYGDFITQVSIPWAIDTDRVEAHYEAGFLTVTLARTNRSTKRVTVQVVGDEPASEKEE